jgi:ribosome maturation factor RimP
MSPAPDVLLATIQELARDAAARTGVEVVDLIFRRQGKHSVLRIDIDRPGTAGVALADCEAMSRALEPGLDALEALPESYDLQVSSPGLERPIQTSDDLRRNTGRRIVVETTELVDGVKVFRGNLLGERDGALVLEDDDGGETAILLSAVRMARQDLDPPPHRRKEGR